MSSSISSNSLNVVGLGLWMVAQTVMPSLASVFTNVITSSAVVESRPLRGGQWGWAVACVCVFRVRAAGGTMRARGEHARQAGRSLLVNPIHTHTPLTPESAH